MPLLCSEPSSDFPQQINTKVLTIPINSYVLQSPPPLWSHLTVVFPPPATLATSLCLYRGWLLYLEGSPLFLSLSPPLVTLATRPCLTPYYKLKLPSPSTFYYFSLLCLFFLSLVLFNIIYCIF